ncbi:MAG: hypothetical protein ACLQF1_10395 [Methyloceanibacter sp.]
MTDRRSITLPLCVLGAGAVHGLCVAALLPMLITLPGPGNSGPSVIDVEVMPASASTETGADSVGNGSHASDATAAATLHPSAPNELGNTGAAPETTSALPAAAEPVPPPAQPFGGSPSLADAAPPSETSDPAGSAQSGPISANAAPPAETLRAIEPDLSSPTVAESASTGTDPVTTQSTTPLAETGQVDAAAAKDASSTGAQGSEPPAASEGPETSPSMARAEPPSSSPAATAPEASAASKESNTRPEPKAKAPAKAEMPAQKTRAEPVKRTPLRARRAVKAKAQAPVEQGGVFKSLFGGPVAAPPGNAGSAASRRATTQR